MCVLEILYNLAVLASETVLCDPERGTPAWTTPHECIISYNLDLIKTVTLVFLSKTSLREWTHQPTENRAGSPIVHAFASALECVCERS